MTAKHTSTKLSSFCQVENQRICERYSSKKPCIYKRYSEINCHDILSVRWPSWVKPPLLTWHGFRVGRHVIGTSLFLVWTLEGMTQIQVYNQPSHRKVPVCIGHGAWLLSLLELGSLKGSKQGGHSMVRRCQGSIGDDVLLLRNRLTFSNLFMAANKKWEKKKKKKEIVKTNILYTNSISKVH